MTIDDVFFSDDPFFIRLVLHMFFFLDFVIIYDQYNDNGDDDDDNKNRKFKRERENE